MHHASLPDALDPDAVGTYPARVFAGGGYVWDAVLEYRVWSHPERGAPDEAGGEDYFHAFASYEDAEVFSRAGPGREEPLALVLQREYIDEPSPGAYRHVAERRLTEWPVSLLSRPKRTPRTIPDFFSPEAPTNRLAVLRGLAEPPR